MPKLKPEYKERQKRANKLREAHVEERPNFVVAHLTEDGRRTLCGRTDVKKKRGFNYIGAIGCSSCRSKYSRDYSITVGMWAD